MKSSRRERVEGAAGAAPPGPRLAAIGPAPATRTGAGGASRVWRYALTVGGIALAVRSLHLWQIQASPFATVLVGDAKAYDAWAQRIAAGDWFGSEVFYQAPLYPYFAALVYAVVGRDLLLLRVCQAVIGSASCILIGLAARRLVSPGAGWVAGLGLALYAPAVFFDGLIQKTVLDVFLVCLALWLIAVLTDQPRTDAPWRPPVWTALGAVLGALSLTRENAMILVAVVAVWAATRRHPPAPAVPGGESRRRPPTDGSRRASVNLAAVGALLLGAALVLLPVAVRNFAVGGTLVLTTTQFGPNFYIGNNPSATGGYVPLRVGRGSPEYERQDAVALAEQTTGRTLTPSEVSAFWSAQAIDFITSQPGQWLRLMGRKLLLLVNSVEMVDSESEDSYAEWSAVLRVGGRVGHFGVLMPLAAFGIWAAWPWRRRLWIVYAILATYALTVVLFYVFARYRFPLVPALWLFAAAGLVHGPARLGALPRSGRMMAGGIVALLVAVTNWPLLSRAQMQAATETNLGAELYEQGRYQDAVGHYERAIRFDPSHAPAYNNLGVALAAQDQIPRAIDSYERAIALRSDFADAHYNLGNALLAGGRPAEAGAHFAEARKLLPSNADVHNNLGLAMMAEGRVEQGVAEFRSALAADPESVIARRNLADALAARGQFDEAVAHLQRAVELRDDPALRYDLGSILLESGRPADAEVHLRAAAAGRPGWAEAHNNLGIALGSLGRIDEAIDQFRRALAAREDFGDARRNLAVAEAARAAARPPASPVSTPPAPR